jgi:hypothetical protein
MPTPVTARYRDVAGRWHNVVVRQTRDGHWQVLDITRLVSVVETLTGCEEGRPQADALAREYATNQHRCAIDQPSTTDLAA